MEYCTSELPLDITRVQDISIDTYWHKIGLLKDDSGQLKYSLLSKLAKSVLIVPHGNADVERLFSHMGLTKTKLRNSLGVDTLTALLRLQFNVKEPCFSFKPTHTMVSRCRNAIESLNLDWIIIITIILCDVCIVNNLMVFHIMMSGYLRIFLSGYLRIFEGYCRITRVGMLAALSCVYVPIWLTESLWFSWISCAVGEVVWGRGEW